METPTYQYDADLATKLKSVCNEYLLYIVTCVEKKTVLEILNRDESPYKGLFHDNNVYSTYISITISKHKNTGKFSFTETDLNTLKGNHKSEVNEYIKYFMEHNTSTNSINKDTKKMDSANTGVKNNILADAAMKYYYLKEIFSKHNTDGVKPLYIHYIESEPSVVDFIEKLEQKSNKKKIKGILIGNTNSNTTTNDTKAAIDTLLKQIKYNPAESHPIPQNVPTPPVINMKARAPTVVNDNYQCTIDSIYNKILVLELTVILYPPGDVYNEELANKLKSICKDYLLYIVTMEKKDEVLNKLNHNDSPYKGLFNNKNVYSTYTGNGSNELKFVDKANIRTNIKMYDEGYVIEATHVKHNNKNNLININKEDKIKASHKYYCLQQIQYKYKSIAINYIDSDKSFMQFISLLEKSNENKMHTYRHLVVNPQGNIDATIDATSTLQAIISAGYTD